MMVMMGMMVMMALVMVMVMMLVLVLLLVEEVMKKKKSWTISPESTSAAMEHKS